MKVDAAVVAGGPGIQVGHGKVGTAAAVAGDGARGHVGEGALDPALGPSGQTLVETGVPALDVADQTVEPHVGHLVRRGPPDGARPLEDVHRELDATGQLGGDRESVGGPRVGPVPGGEGLEGGDDPARSEEHTSELQSLMRISYAVFCLKKKNNTTH